MLLVSRFVNLKLRVKLLMAFGSLMLLTVFLAAVAFNRMRRTDELQSLNLEINILSRTLMEADGHLQRFMYEGYKEPQFHETGESHHLEAYNENAQRVRESFQRIVAQSNTASAHEIDMLSEKLEHIEGLVNRLVATLKQRGFKDHGLEGSLREAIHTVEKAPYQYDRADMLMLRRHEKDFFLRNDLKYRDEFNAQTDKFIQSLAGSNLEASEKSAIIGYLKDYRKKFNRVVQLDSLIGLQQTSGLKGEINEDLKLLQTNLLSLRDNVQAHLLGYKRNSMAILLVAVVTAIVLCVVLAILYADLITRAIKQILHRLRILSEGQLPGKLPVVSSEEIGKTKVAINQLIDRIQAAVSFSEALGEGNLGAKYDDRFDKDIFARSLTRLQHKLAVAEEKQRINNWTNEGTVQLNAILKNEHDDIALLGDQIIRMLVRYLKANQAALYVVKREEDGAVYLDRISTYAYDKKRFLSHRVNPGEGQVGECFLQKSTIELRVPQHFIKITSGLGEATPSFVVVVPLMVREDVTGVLEMASFVAFEDYQIRFLESIGETIAVLLNSKNVAMATAELLRDAREREQQLRAQEEELRQNAEELQAVQEQMQRQHRELEKEVGMLRALLREQAIEE